VASKTARGKKNRAWLVKSHVAIEVTCVSQENWHVANEKSDVANKIARGNFLQRWRCNSR
jgi:hypothetical protein